MLEAVSRAGTEVRREREGCVCYCCNVEFFVIIAKSSGWTKLATWQIKLNQIYWLKGKAIKQQYEL